jgi:hypothetical protein
MAREKMAVADQAEANAGGQPALTREQREQLIWLRWLWPGYKIDCDGRTWSASPSIAPDEVITADTHQALWGKIKTDNGLRDWPKRTGYWVERMSGPPFWVDTSGRPGSGFRQSG